MEDLKLFTREEAQRIADYHERVRVEREERRIKQITLVDCDACCGHGTVATFLRKPVPHERVDVCGKCQGQRKVVLQAQPKLPHVYTPEERMARTILALMDQLNQ